MFGNRQAEQSVPKWTTRNGIGTKCSYFLQYLQKFVKSLGMKDKEMGLNVKNSMRDVLLAELDRRRARNSMYSLRAFSRDLGIGLGSLSEVLSGKRDLSKSNVLKILQSIEVSKEQKELLLNKDKTSKNQINPQDEYQLLLEDQFKLISDWYYLAILNLAKIKKNKANADWIAERLGVENYRVIEALERLQRLGLLSIEKNKLVRTAQPLTTSRDLPSTAIRKHHAQNLLLAEQSLHRDEVQLREFGSVTMPVNMKNLPKLKELLLKTRKKAADLLEEGETTEVYTLSFQLFPLTKLKKK